MNKTQSELNQQFAGIGTAYLMDDVRNTRKEERFFKTYYKTLVQPLIDGLSKRGVSEEHLNKLEFSFFTNNNEDEEIHLVFKYPNISFSLEERIDNFHSTLEKLASALVTSVWEIDNFRAYGEDYHDKFIIVENERYKPFADVLDASDSYEGAETYIFDNDLEGECTILYVDFNGVARYPQI